LPSSGSAFADGRPSERAARELEAVLAHELSHVKNYDTLVMTLAVTMVGIISLLSDFFLRFMFWGGGRDRNDNNDAGPFGGFKQSGLGRELGRVHAEDRQLRGRVTEVRDPGAHEVEHLPVVDSDRHIVGMCTRTDILRARSRHLTAEDSQEGWHAAWRRRRSSPN